MIAFETIDEVREFVNVSADYDLDKFNTFVEAARNELQMFFDSDWDILEEVFASSIPDKDKLHRMARGVLAAKAMILALDESSMNLGDNGATVYKGGNDIVASDTKIAAYRASVETRIRQALSIILDLMRANPAVFVNGRELTNKSCLVQYAQQTRKCLKQLTTLECFEMYGDLLRVQQVELPVGAEMLSELLDKGDELTGDKMNLLTACRNYLLAVAAMKDNGTATAMKDHIIALARRISPPAPVADEKPINGELKGLFITH